MHRQPQSSFQQSRPQPPAGTLVLLLSVLLTGLLAATSLAQPAQQSLVVIEVAQGIFEDARVRRALTLAAPWQRMAEGSGLRPDTVLLRHGDRETALDAPPADPEMVQRLLAEAGITRREPRPYALFYAPALERLAETSLKVLSQYGLEGQLQVMTSQTRERLLAATRYATGSQRAEIPYLILTQEQLAAPEPPRLADLIIFGEMVIDYDPQERLLTVTTGVANIGNAPAAASILSVREIDGALRFQPVEIGRYGIQQSGAFKSFAKVPERLLGREIRLQATIDADDRIRESNERNNQGEVWPYTLPAAAPSLPDLTLRGAPLVDYNESTRELTVTVVAANIGTVAAGAHELEIADRSGTLVFSPLRLEGLGPRAKQDLPFSLRVPEESLGARIVLVAQIDSGKNIREENEDNNVSVAQAFTLPSPIPRPIRRPTPPEADLTDLIAESLSIAFDPERRHLRATVTYSNRSDTAAGRHEVVVTELDNRIVLRPAFIPGLAPGASQDTTFETTLAPQLDGETLRLQAVVDSDNALKELQEDNNASAIETVALPETPSLADLVITAMQVRESARGDALEVRVTIANRGAAASAPSEIELRAERVGSFQRFILPALEIGAGTEIAWEIPYQPPLLGGSLHVVAFADPDNSLVEVLENNNRGDQTLVLAVPLRSWGLAALVALAALLPIIWLLRRPAARHAAPDPAVRLSFRPQRDPGSQEVEFGSQGTEPSLRLTLRPHCDAGRQFVVMSGSD